jgi:hypothetical protein
VNDDDLGLLNDLGPLQDEFPAYTIWRESAHGRRRYVACQRRRGPGPHTVITADLGELRDALLPSRPDRPAVPAGEPQDG